MPAYKLIDDIVVPYLEATSQSRKLSTQEAEKYCLNRLREFFNNHWLSHDLKYGRKVITGDVVRQYRERRKLSVSPQTVKRELALASKAVNYAIRECDLIIPNPFQGRLISSSDQNASGPRDWHMLTETEERKLLLACGIPLRDIVVLALNTGMRQSEILNLCWAGDDKTRYPYISGNLVVFNGKAQKSGKKGIRALNAAALEAIERQPKKGERVFGCINRHRFYHLMWNPARVKAGLPKLRFHDLRKICGQRLVEAGVKIEHVQYQLGHSDLKTTQRIYTKAPVDLLLEAVGRL